MFTEAIDPVWANEEHTAITVTVKHPQYGYIPFCAMPTDDMEYGRKLFADLVAGMYGEIAPFVEFVGFSEPNSQGAIPVTDTGAA